MYKKIDKMKESFVLLLLLFSTVIAVLPKTVNAEDPNIDPYVAPGAPDGITMEELLKIGILDDMNYITGEHTWNGAMLAAREINEAGGLFVNSSYFYIGLVSENTFEAEPMLDITKAVDAANKMIADYDPHVIMGGFRTEALLAYIEPIMDAKIPFICTGCAGDIFTQNVHDNYARYKYFFRTMLNATEIARDYIIYLPYLAATLTASIGKDVTKVGILREDLDWTIGMANALKAYLPIYGLEIVEEIALPFGSSEQDFRTAMYHLDDIGVQILFPIYSSGYGISIGRAYGDVQPRFLMCGINVFAQLGSYWDETYGGAQYEITAQGTYRTAKTPKTIPFWDNYVANYSTEPLYSAVSTYDAVYLLSNATTSTQSFMANEIIQGFENINSTNIYTGVAGNLAFSSYHQILGGPNYVPMLFCQWQGGANKVVLSSGNILYPESLATGALAIPEWGLNPRELIYGVGFGPSDLEPLNAWDSNSIDVIDQVVESLFAYNLSDPNMALIPSLALDFGAWSPDNLNYTVDLKQNILFHDGSPFNATAVHWNFNRIAYFMNVSGTLPAYETFPAIQSLFRWPDGTPIINHTEVLDTYKIRFVLNKPFGAIETILGFWGTSILSPYSTPETEYIDTFTGNLVGTGPYVYDEYTEGIDVWFHAFEDYRDGIADMELLQFLVIPDSEERNDALVNGEIDFLDAPHIDRISTFEDDPNISVISGQNTLVRYITMNNEIINKTMRQAISYSINYTHIIEAILDGQGTRLQSPLPETILYANWSFDVATFDVTRAREILVNAGVCSFDIYDDSEWTYAAANNPIAIYNYTYYFGSQQREDLGFLLQQNLAHIGVRVDLEGMDFSDFLYRYFDNHYLLELCFIGWIADYNDPCNYFNNLFSNRSNFNVALINDPYLEALIEQGLVEVDPILREAIYDEMQQYLVEDLMPYAWVTGGFYYDVYRKEFTGFQSNSLGKTWFYTVERQDITPPETYYYLDGIQNPFGWFESDVTVTLSATDYFSGVQFINYSFDGVFWQYYTEPIVISEEGLTIILYRSTDYNGNIEDTKYLNIYKYSFFSHRDLVFGTDRTIHEIDPLHAWADGSYYVLDQIAEGLFASDLSHPEMAVTPRLAVDFGTWSGNKLEYTVNIRENVLFHDGTELDAAAVVWNFNRLAYFMNVTGELPWDQMYAMTDPLFRWPDGTPIIDYVTAVGPYTVKFVLNRPYAAFEALLAFPASYILSPHSTPDKDYLYLPDGTGIMYPFDFSVPDYWYPVGTGPFRMEFYIRDAVAKFSPFGEYWQGRPKLESLIFSYIEDAQERNNALLSGDVDFILNPLPSMFDTFETDPSITLLDADNTAYISYIGMNNKQINKTMRQAISYAINYSYIIDVLLEGQGIRLKSPIPNGLLYANWSFNGAIFNFTRAREILLDAGIVSGLDPHDDSAWTDLVDYGTPIASFNYSYNIGNMVREGILYLLQENLRMIGIEVIDAGMTWTDFLFRLFDIAGLNRDMVQLFSLPWIPDLNDPSNFLNDLFLEYNFAQVEDPYLEDLLAQGLSELNPTLRRAIYNEIQRYIVEDLMPVTFTYTRRNFYAYNDEFAGYEPNALQKLWFYNMYRVTPFHNETAEWGVSTGEELIWDVSGLWLEMMYPMMYQTNPVQWKMHIDDINLTYWKDVPIYKPPYDYYSTVWATTYNRSTAEDPWELMIPAGDGDWIYYNATEQLIYNRFLEEVYQNWVHLLIPTPVNLEILNKTLYERHFGYFWVESSIIGNSIEIILDTGDMDVTLNLTYNDQGILTYGWGMNYTDVLLEFIYYAPDSTPPIWVEIPTDQQVELGQYFSYHVSAYDESGIDHYWISDTENFGIDSYNNIVSLDVLEVGAYELEVRAYDPYNNYCSASFTVNVVDTTPPYGIGTTFDTIPDSTYIYYSRNPQVIGSLKVFDNSPISNVELWNISLHWNTIDEGFSVITTHHPKSYENVYNFSYISDIVIMTTNLLKEGEHRLNLRVYDACGNVADKYFNITVYKLLYLKLSGEFDYLEKEKVKISLVATLYDVDSGREVSHYWIEDMGIVVRIYFEDADGNFLQLPLGSDQMTHEFGGMFRWHSPGTINDLKNLFKKGVYTVGAYIKFFGAYEPYYWYYLCTEEWIQIHIDPPLEEEPDVWLIFTFAGYGVVLLLSVAISILYIRKYKLKFT
jgi:branched-chain amino acid transport system substrate-binding protein